MARIICISHFKGGVGKTFISNSLAVMSAFEGKKTLLIDCDAQSNQRMMFGIEADEITLGTYEFIVDGLPLHECCYPINTTLTLLPATYELSRFDEDVLTNPKKAKSKYTLLHEALRPYYDDYDVIVIDLPPTIGSLITKNAFLLPGVDVIIPTTPEENSYEGIADVIRVVDEIRMINSTIQIRGIIVNRVKWNSLTHSRVKKKIKSLAEDNHIFYVEESIPDSVKVPESTEKHALSVVMAMPKSNVAVQMKKIYKELIGND